MNPLNNLFVIASQAHTVDNGNKSELENILDAGSKRLYNLVPEEIWENREEQSGYVHTEPVLRKRFLHIQQISLIYESPLKMKSEKF